jgi:hypothetical protein
LAYPHDPWTEESKDYEPPGHSLLQARMTADRF